MMDGREICGRILMHSAGGSRDVATIKRNLRQLLVMFSQPIDFKYFVFGTLCHSEDTVPAHAQGGCEMRLRIHNLIHRLPACC